MSLNNLIPRIKKYISSYLEFRKQTKNHKVYKTPSNEKSIVVKISDPRIFKRYFYTFIKFFSLAGYSIYFPNINFKYFKNNIYNKNSNLYRLIYDEKFIIFNTPPKKAKIIFSIEDINLSPDYFSSFFLKNVKKNHFIIPMTMHPLFYNKGLWNTELDNNRTRKKSIFMVGCFNQFHYSKIKNTPFSIESRYEVYEYLKKKNLLKSIKSKKELISYIDSSNDFSCILMDSEKTPIDIQNLRNTINKFSFYLALPGVIMPLAHNLVEALSTGAIPIIHKTYAKLMNPALKHMQNAIIYESLQDLEEKINLAYKIDSIKLKKMENNVNEYYRTNLTPNAVINKIINTKNAALYLQAEFLSVKILQNNLNNKETLS